MHDLLGPSSAALVLLCAHCRACIAVSGTRPGGRGDGLGVFAAPGDRCHRRPRRLGPSAKSLRAGRATQRSTDGLFMIQWKGM